MMDSLLRCMSVSRNGRSSNSNNDFKSVLEIDPQTIEDHAKCKHITDKHKSCCKLELFIPGRILKIFHADGGMTRLEKSEYSISENFSK